MVAHDSSNFRITLYFREYALANLGVTLHLTSFLKCERTGFFEQARRKTDLSNVMDKATYVDKTLIIDREPQLSCNISCINRDRR